MGTLEMRRTRIIDAMVEVVCEAEEGFAGASVASVCARADVSRRAFYDAFDSRESCFLAALDEGSRRASLLVRQSFERAEFWLDGLRTALAELVLFFEAEPLWARFYLVESVTAGRWALERREQHVATLPRLITGLGDMLLPEEPYPFASDSVMAAVLSILQNHMLACKSDSFSDLLGPLMGIAVAPYLEARDVAGEIERSEVLAQDLLATRNTRPAAVAKPEVTMPDLLLDPRSHRSRRCVLYLAQHPGASNRQIARAIGIARDSQTSTMLARLARLGLLFKHQTQPGLPNAWILTPNGHSIARTLQDGLRAEADANGLKAMLL